MKFLKWIFLFVFCITANAQTSLISNLDKSVDLTNYSTGGDTWIAQAFTTDGTEYQLNSVTCKLSPGCNNVVLKLYSSSSGNVGLLLTNFGSGTDLGDNNYQFSPNISVNLSPSTTYWLVLNPVNSSSPSTYWYATYSTKYSGNGNLPDQCIAESLDEGETWSNYYPITDGPYMFEVKATAVLPVELTSFTATVADKKIVLFWRTATEVNNYGFEIERKSFDAEASSLGHYSWEKIGFVEGSGNSSSPKNYSFTDNLDLILDPDLVLGYRLKQIDIDGTFSYSDEIEIKIDLLPSSFELFQNYPNPFNPTTKIKYSLPIGIEASYMTSLRIYDVLGNEVSTLVNEQKKPGVYEVEFDAGNLASGMYIYKMEAGSFICSKKFMIIK